MITDRTLAELLNEMNLKHVSTKTARKIGLFIKRLLPVEEPRTKTGVICEGRRINVLCYREADIETIVVLINMFFML
jgi:hypothetical protein